MMTSVPASNKGIEDPDPSKLSEDVRHAHISLNEILNQAMNKFQPVIRRMDVIIRCQPLPVINGNWQQMIKLFSGVIGTVLNNPPVKQKLFLYVNCEEEVCNKTNFSSFDPSNKRYRVRFQTNVSLDEKWEKEHRAFLDECSAVLLSHNGTMEVNEFKRTGCLFSLSLPGKME